MKTVSLNTDTYRIDAFENNGALHFTKRDIHPTFSNGKSTKKKAEKPTQGLICRAEKLLGELVKSSSFSLGTRLCLPTQRGFIIVNMEEIIYCEAQRSYTRFHLVNNKSFMVSKPVSDYDRLFDDSVFLRVHKSFLVNLLHVKEYTRGEGGTITLSNNMEITVSRRKKVQFLAKIKRTFKS